MNNERRKIIEKVRAAIDSAKAELEQARELLEPVRDEEVEAFEKARAKDGGVRQQAGGVGRQHRLGDRRAGAGLRQPWGGDRMIAHTPGPWNFGTKRLPYSISHGPSLLLGVESEAGIGEVGKANARLIAAAPEMLAWLERNYRIEEGPGETDRPQYIELRELLAKVKGEGK